MFRLYGFQKAQLREPLLIQEPPGRPWSIVGSDLFEFNGIHYLLNVDCYSKWIEIAKLDDLTSNNIICHVKSQFARYCSDNDPQYASSAFKDFGRSYGFVHTTSSPHYPQSNGEAERAVQTIEILLKKAQDPYKALLNYRITPLDGIDLSPAQILMGRRLKTSLPTDADLLKPRGGQEIKQQLQKIKERVESYYDKYCSKKLPPLDEGDKVTMKHDKKWIQATIVDKHHTPRSYIVQTPEGQRYRRNRRHLNKSRASEVLSKEIVATNTLKVGQTTSRTCTGTSLHGKLSETEAPNGYTQKPEVHTRSVKQKHQLVIHRN